MSLSNTISSLLGSHLELKESQTRRDRQLCDNTLDNRRQPINVPEAQDFLPLHNLLYFQSL